MAARRVPPPPPSRTGPGPAAPRRVPPPPEPSEADEPAAGAPAPPPRRVPPPPVRGAGGPPAPPGRKPAQDTDSVSPGSRRGPAPPPPVRAGSGRIAPPPSIPKPRTPPAAEDTPSTEDAPEPASPSAPPAPGRVPPRPVRSPAPGAPRRAPLPGPGRVPPAPARAAKNSEEADESPSSPAPPGGPRTPGRVPPPPVRSAGRAPPTTPSRPAAPAADEADAGDDEGTETESAAPSTPARAPPPGPPARGKPPGPPTRVGPAASPAPAPPAPAPAPVLPALTPVANHPLFGGDADATMTRPPSGSHSLEEQHSHLAPGHPLFSEPGVSPGTAIAAAAPAPAQARETKDIAHAGQYGAMSSGAQPTTKMQQPSELLSVPDLSAMSAQEIALEFVKSEEMYLKKGLRVVTRDYETRLKNHVTVKQQVLSPAEISSLFLNISNIYEFHQQLLSELRALREQGGNHLVEGLGKVMTKFSRFFKMYSQYIMNHRENAKFLQAAAKRRHEFQKFLALNELCFDCKLSTLLTAPTTRLAQYLLFLGTLHEKIESDSSAEAQELEKAIRAIQAVTDDISVTMRDTLSRKLVVTIQTEVFNNTCDLLDPTRFVVKHGDLRTIGTATFGGSKVKMAYIALFNDCLLHGSRGNKIGGPKVKYVMRLQGMYVEEQADSVEVKNAFRIKSRTHKPFVLIARNQPEKNKWMEALRETITKADAFQLRGLTGEDFERMVTKKKPKSGMMTMRPSVSLAGGHIGMMSPEPKPSPGPGGAPAAPPMTPAASGAGSSVPMAPEFDAPPMAPAFDAPPMAPAFDAPPMDAPPMDDDGPSFVAPTLRPARPPPSSPAPSSSGPDFLSSIRGAGVTSLKKASDRKQAPPPKAAAAPPVQSLQQALKSSLDTYRKFVQDDDEDHDAGGDDEWDDD